MDGIEDAKQANMAFPMLAARRLNASNNDRFMHERTETRPSENRMCDVRPPRMRPLPPAWQRANGAEQEPAGLSNGSTPPRDVRERLYIDRQDTPSPSRVTAQQLTGREAERSSRRSRRPAREISPDR